MDNIAYLISENRYKDSRGIWHKDPLKKRVFCRIRSVSANEFFEGGRNGLNPQYQMTVFAGDYSGERIVEIGGDQYAVYRTYRPAPGMQINMPAAMRNNGDYVELYVERKGGTNELENG